MSGFHGNVTNNEIFSFGLTENQNLVDRLEAQNELPPERDEEEDDDDDDDDEDEEEEDDDGDDKKD